MKDEVSVCVALLHDVVEDTATTFEDLVAQGISDNVIAALRLLTHDNAVPYMDYIQKIKASDNATAIAVKLADLTHNSDTTRLERVDERTAKRLKKYRSAIEILVGT
jgi:(p)ppGpp synthase/HD superfamily hydrolase